MALTKKQTAAIENILYHAERAQRYILKDGTAIAHKGGPATTTLHCVNQRGDVLYEVDKHIGSDITGLYDVVKYLKLLLHPPAIEVEQ